MMLKRQDAFTLVELLAVIIILGIILVLAVPRVSDMINKYRDKAYERQLDLILKTAEQYSIFYEDEIEWEDNQAYIYLEDLQNKDLIASPLKNPKGGEFEPDRVVVTLTSLNGVIDYAIAYLGPPIPITLASIIDDYYYGPDPDNWIEFGTIDDTPVLWRIIKIDNEGIKIIYEGKRRADNTQPDDDGRIKVDGTYNIAWDTTGGQYGSNKWERPADLMEVLNTWYTAILDKNEQQIALIQWCIGKVPHHQPEGTPISEFSSKECTENYSGYPGKTTVSTGVGLIRPSDYMDASDGGVYCYSSYGYDDDGSFNGYHGEDCGITEDGVITNFLYKEEYDWWTHTAGPGVWYVSSGGWVDATSPSYARGVRPVLNLKSDILYDSGEGTISSPYIVK